jgi:hypothetical protein
MMTLYLACLIIGGIFIVVSLFFDTDSGADGDIDLDADLDLDADTLFDYRRYFYCGFPVF